MFKQYTHDKNSIYQRKYATLERLYFNYAKIFGSPDETDPVAVKDYIFMMMAHCPKIFVKFDDPDFEPLDE